MEERINGDDIPIVKSIITSQGTTSFPTKGTMVKNIIGAAHLAMQSGFKLVTDENQEQRQLICKTACSFYVHESARCLKCGCWITYKSRLEAWHCPIDKW